mmetsp:Transcript_18323/g.61315  ORF Transcript_18323/g.61315 Transcript_18323/m.61315 type:complete len:282 (-) Transcript_18323:902-1747(-)
MMTGACGAARAAQPRAARAQALRDAALSNCASASWLSSESLLSLTATCWMISEVGQRCSGALSVSPTWSVSAESSAVVCAVSPRLCTGMHGRPQSHAAWRCSRLARCSLTNTAICTISSTPTRVEAHPNPSRADMKEPARGPSIWPREKHEVMSADRPLIASSLRSMHDSIMSSMSGVMDMASPRPKSTRAITTEASVAPSAAHIHEMRGDGPMIRKPTPWSATPTMITLRGPRRCLWLNQPITGEARVYTREAMEKRIPTAVLEVTTVRTCEASVGSRKA